MSLIPSESHSFPDDFSRSISHARVLHEVKAVRAAIKPQPRKGRAITTPPAPAAPVAPATSRAAPVREARSSSNVHAAKPFGPVRATKRVDVDLVTKPQESAATQIEMSLGDEVAIAPLKKIRRRRKWARFLVAEVFAIAVLVPSAIAALTHYFANPSLILTMNLLTIVSAIIAAVVPIIFFAIPPTLPRN